MKLPELVVFILILAFFVTRQLCLCSPEIETIIISYTENSPLGAFTVQKGAVEWLGNFTVVLISIAGIILACITSPEPKPHKDKAEQKSKRKSNVKQKKTAAKRSRKVKAKSSPSPFKEYFTDSKEKTK